MSYTTGIVKMDIEPVVSAYEILVFIASASSKNTLMSFARALAPRIHNIWKEMNAQPKN